MTATPPSRDSGDNEAGLDRESPPGRPRWVKVILVAVAVLVLLVVVMLVVKGGDHGPSRHAPTENQEQTVDPTSSSSHDPSKRGH